MALNLPEFRAGMKAAYEEYLDDMSKASETYYDKMWSLYSQFFDDPAPAKAEISTHKKSA